MKPRCRRRTLIPVLSLWVAGRLALAQDDVKAVIDRALDLVGESNTPQSVAVLADAAAKIAHCGHGPGLGDYI